jgi:hypothetical protein
MSDIKWGTKCYRCKSDVKDFSEVAELVISNPDDDHISICKSCNRETKFNQLENRFMSGVDRFNRFIVSNKYDKFQKILLVLITTFILGGIIIDILFDINIISNIGICFNMLFWFLTIYRHGYTSKKKVSQ